MRQQKETQSQSTNVVHVRVMNSAWIDQLKNAVGEYWGDTSHEQGEWD